MNILVGAARLRGGRVLAMVSVLALGACTLDGEGTAEGRDGATAPLRPDGDGLSASDDASEPFGRRDAGEYPDLPVPSFDAGAEPPDDADPADDGDVDAARDPEGDGGPVSHEPGPMHVDLGRGDGRDVVTLGDSWMQQLAPPTIGIQQSLVRASGQMYRRYARAGVRVLSEEIPKQYVLARNEGPNIKTVVMTGGGGDLVGLYAPGDCQMTGPKCRAQIDRVLERLFVLWNQMAADGVQDVIYIGYSRGKADPGVDYGTREGIARCRAARLRCHWLDSDTVIHGQLRADGVHPTDSGFDQLGQAVYDLMEQEGMRR